MADNIDSIMDEMNLIDQVVHSEVKEASKRILEILVHQTPLGMPSTWQSPPPPDYQPGTARASWIVSIDRPDYSLPGQVDPGGGSTIAIGQAMMALFDPKRNKEIIIQSNIPYMNRLNYGWSQQAPAGFIEAAVSAGQFAR